VALHHLENGVLCETYVVTEEYRADKEESSPYGRRNFAWAKIGFVQIANGTVTTAVCGKSLTISRAARVLRMPAQGFSSSTLLLRV
jgi:hypothetical protein